MHAGVPSPFRAGLRAIFEGLERSDRHRAGNSQQYQLPIFMTSMDTFQAVQVCAGAVLHRGTVSTITHHSESSALQIYRLQMFWAAALGAVITCDNVPSISRIL